MSLSLSAFLFLPSLLKDIDASVLRQAGDERRL